MKVSIDQIRKLREETGAPVIRAKQVLEEVLGDLPAKATPEALRAGEKKAREILMKEGFEKAEDRAERVTSQGLVEVYAHHSGKVASMVELFCETDFVAKNELFKTLAHDLALQAAGVETKSPEDFLKQDFIKDPSKKISSLVKEVIAKTGENIKVGRVVRIELGK